MPRRDDITYAFYNSIVLEPSGRRIVKTTEFVRNLEKYNHHFSLTEANAWIRRYAQTFRDCSTEEGERKIWFQYNPNGGI